MADPDLPVAAKRRRIRDALDWRAWSDPVVLPGRDPPGDAETPTDPDPPRSWPLHQVDAPWLWLELTLTASPAGETPRASSLRVFYPELSLMRQLPAVYRAADDPGRDHLRRLVALIESVAQGLDQRIGTLGHLLDPAGASGPWLDFLASWLGMPWHASLDDSAKRKLLAAAPDLLARRGTRAGLRALLELLLPGRPVRIVDPATDLPPLVLGAASGRGGTTLPAALLGAPRDTPRLGPRSVLGRFCLRPEGPADDPAALLAGWLRVEVPASEAERQRLGPALDLLIAAFVPAGVRVVRRWRPWPRARGGGRIGDLVLEGRGPGVVGRDGRLGRIVLAGEEPAELPGDGIAVGFGLM
jgi:phage tail-like protein